MGDGAGPALAAAVAAMPGLGAALAGAGLPFVWEEPDPSAVSRALLADGRALASLPAAAPGPETVELVLPPRGEWEVRVLACLDHAAARAAAGLAPDPLDALLVAPGIDLRAAAGMADTDARLRFAAGMAGCGMDPERFGRSYWRRSAAAGILAAIAEALSAPPGEVGTDETGWPVWWQGTGAGRAAALASAPPAVAACGRQADGEA